MLNNILDFSKIQKGKIKFNFEKIETASFINSVIEKFKLSIKEQKFEFLINIPNSLPLINGDKNSLIRVLNNRIRPINP
ncbi:MAG: hypothetical protein KAT05_04050 [Spirochaetes bacterium]|nr:hypothetical protein [Spirochaetota bacterium]